MYYKLTLQQRRNNHQYAMIAQNSPNFGTQSPHTHGN